MDKNLKRRVSMRHAAGPERLECKKECRSGGLWIGSLWPPESRRSGCRWCSSKEGELRFACLTLLSPHIHTHDEIAFEYIRWIWKIEDEERCNNLFRFHENCKRPPCDIFGAGPLRACSNGSKYFCFRAKVSLTIEEYFRRRVADVLPLSRVAVLSSLLSCKRLTYSTWWEESSIFLSSPIRTLKKITYLPYIPTL